MELHIKVMDIWNLVTESLNMEDGEQKLKFVVGHEIRPKSTVIWANFPLILDSVRFD